ncbi:MAG: TIGR04279 domain-containing protein [Bacteroidota bacterium]|nr:TIGR04279 domain-containing protein [Bacteroidota bacterium]
MYLKKSLLILALTLFILTSATTIAGNNEKSVSPIGNINFTDRVVYVLDHTSNPEEGNWITMGCPSEGRKIQLPQPIRFTYCGPKSTEYDGVSGTLYKSEDENYTITYPSTLTYCTHPIYLPGEEVNMSFHGDSSLKGEVEIYLFNVTSKSVYGLLDAFKAGDIGNLSNLFQKNMDGNYKKYSTVLGKNGDLLDYNFGPLDAGQYCIVIAQENEDGGLTVLSATAFIVAEYELHASAPASITKGEDLDISMSLENIPDENNCTFGAILIRDQAYKANIKVDSNGTKNGTSVTVNEINLIDEFDINSSNYRSKLTRNELQTEIQTIIGEGKGSIAIGEKGQKSLSLTAFDLPQGSYYLFAGAYSPGKGLVGLTQSEVKIKSKDSSENNGNSGNGGNNGNSGNGGKVKSQNELGNSPEPAQNVKSKEICQQSISKGNQISFEFAQEVTPVDYIQFNAKKTTGKTTAVVENLNGKSSLVLSEPKGEVYKYLNISIGNEDFANSNNIENAVVGFKVSKDWITENHINADSIVLQHFSVNDWSSLPTKKVSEDKEYIYCEAETPSFSPFAITAEKNLMVIEKKTGETQIPLERKTQNGPGSMIGSNTFAQENMNSGISKITSFSIGFLIVILIGTIVKKKVES